MSTVSEGTRINGNYRLERPLARGGMGTLWVAFDERLGRRVAIKLLREDLSDDRELRARFEREAWAAAQVQSPYVVQTYDYGVDDGVPFIVLELLQGEDLRCRLERQGRLAVPQAQRLFAQILRGLDAVHAEGVVHRDLKPANIFLSRTTGEEVVKVVDFGVARAGGPESGRDVTRTGQIVGTPRYMSPEQVCGARDLGPRSDLWAVAVVLYRALTGQHAFPGGDLQKVMKSIGTASVRPPSELCPELPPGLDAFMARALERDPARRFQSAAEMLHALAALRTCAPERRTLAPPAAAPRIRPEALPLPALRPAPLFAALGVGLARAVGLLGA